MLNISLLLHSGFPEEIETRWMGKGINLTCSALNIKKDDGQINLDFYTASLQTNTPYGAQSAHISL